MLLKIVKNKSVVKSNPSIEYKVLFPNLSKLSDDEQKILLLMFDLKSPFAAVPIVVRGERVAKYLAVDLEKVERIIKSVESDKTNSLKDSVKDIASKQFDTVLYMYQSLNNQLFTLSRQIDSIKIDIRSEDDKTFDRFVKFASDSKKIVENIAYIKEQCRDESEISMLEFAAGGGTDNSKSFIDKLYSTDI
tara:strand:- start:947 stop:1519 length:573 start_codon:yes stop_codon:yes gene_type:complete